MYIEGQTMADIYQQVRPILLAMPEIAPRGAKTREIAPLQFCLLNPRHCLMYHPDRKFHLPQAIVETALLFSNTNQLNTAAFFNPKIRDFSDDGVTLYGAYGARVSRYMFDIVNKLTVDPDSRQAILTIVNSQDMTVQTKDVPCTIALQFLIRRGHLDLHVYMRSNDFIWGTQYDVFVFTCLQQVIANELKIDVGHYYHTATSMHVYERHYAMLENIKTYDDIDVNIPYLITDMQTIAKWIIRLVDEQPRMIEIPMLVNDVFPKIITNDYLHIMIEIPMLVNDVFPKIITNDYLHINKRPMRQIIEAPRLAEMCAWRWKTIVDK